MSQETDTEKSWWLRSNYAPVSEEIDSHDLPVTGKIPEDLDGLLLRNGPNPDQDPSSHWFLGQGMLHGIRLIDGKAQWYRNRRVPAKALADGNYESWDHRGPSAANTHVVAFAGRIFALEEAHLPHEVTSELESVGPQDFSGRGGGPSGGPLSGPMSAHPKLCPETGTLHAFGVSPAQEPYLTYYQFSPDGNLAHTVPIDLPEPSFMHDFAITSDYVVFLDLSIVYDLGVPAFPARWNAAHKPRIGVLPRDLSQTEPRWLEVEPGFVFHTINACQIGNRIVLDGCYYSTLWGYNPDSFDSPAMVRRYDIHEDFVREETLFDIRCEFPRINEQKLGMPNRYAYVATMAEEQQSNVGFGHRIVKLDMVQHSSIHHHFGPSRYVGEPIFVPRDAGSVGAGSQGAADATAEDDGYVLTMIYNRPDKSSSLVILNAADIGAEPLATITMPQRIPHGFHGSWLPASTLR